MIFGESSCCFCDRKYLNQNMMELQNQITYNNLTKNLIIDHDIDWGFDRACIMCFNHLFINNCEDYRIKIELFKKYGEKNDKDMEDGNKHR